MNMLDRNGDILQNSSPSEICGSAVVMQIPMALDMAKDSNRKDRELKKRILADRYMNCAIQECYASFKNIIKFLVAGEHEKE